MSLSVRIPLAVLLIGLLPSLARPAAPPTSGLDRAGDPLPRGAIARFGTDRFRAPDIQQTLLSPDGRFLAVEIGPRNRSYGRIALFDPAAGTILRSIPLPDSWLPSEAASVLAFTPSGDRLAYLSRYDSTLRVYDTATGWQLHRLMQAEHLFAALAIDAKGSLLAVGLHRKDGAIALLEVYSLATGKRVASFKPLYAVFVGLALSSDGKRLASWGVADPKKPGAGQLNGVVQLWDVAAGKELRRLKLRELPAIGAFRGDGRELALAGVNSVYLCDPATGKVREHLVGQRFRIIPRRGIRYPAGSLAYSANGRQLLCAGIHGNMHLLDARTLETQPSTSVGLRDRVAVTLMADGSFLATSAEGARLVVWDVRSGKRLRAEAHNSEVVGLRFAGAGRLWTASRSGELFEWDRTGRVLRRNFLRDKKDTLEFGTPSLAFSAGGRHVVYQYSLQLILRDASSGKKIGDSIGGCDITSTCLFSADDSLLVLTEGYGGLNRSEVRLIRPESGKELPHLSFKADRRLENLAAAPSPDGRQVAVLVQFNFVTLHLFDTATGRRTAENRLAQDNWVGGQVLFTPDGRCLLSKPWPDEELVLHEVSSGRVAQRIRVGRKIQGRFALCPRGWLAAILTEGEDGPVIRIHEVSSGRMLRVLSAGTKTTALTFSPDGWLLASGHANGTALLWDLLAGSETRDQSTPAELFARLRGADAAAAWQAMPALLRSPARAVVLARDHLRAEWTAPSAAEVQRLIAQLDDDVLQVRQKAQHRLELHVRAAEAALKKALAGKPSPEARRRLRQLLNGVGAPYPRGLAPSLRTVGLLERIGTTEAKAVLKEAAGWQDASRLAEEAKAALARLKKGGGR